MKLIEDKIEENKEEMLESLRELIAIESVEAPALDDMPFGEEVQKAFMYMLDKGESQGFDVRNVDNYGGHIEFGSEDADEVMGIVCHLDVVPAGNDWEHDPFGGETDAGKMYGRGAIDDKGPAIAAYYAMKAVKDCDIVPAKKVRLILGLDEETNWVGMEKYISAVGDPDFGFTPDAEFPAIHGEKGILVFDIAKKFDKYNGSGLQLRSIKGGHAANMVADSARAVVQSDSREIYELIKEKASEWRKEKSVKINVKGIGKSLEVVVQGKSAHGARPEKGINAISILMDFLGQFTYINEGSADFVDFYNKHIGYELDGKSLGCGFTDEPSGGLILNVGKIEMDTRSVRLTVNIRYPITSSDEDVYEAIMPAANKYDLGIVKGKHQLPIYMPLDDPMICTLVDIYRQHTGDAESEPMVIGGGTYARAVKNIIAYGPSHPGEREVAHQQDEFIEIDRLMEAVKIYADAIYRLAAE